MASTLGILGRAVSGLVPSLFWGIGHFAQHIPKSLPAQPADALASGPKAQEECPAHSVPKMLMT